MSHNRDEFVDRYFASTRSPRSDQPQWRPVFTVRNGKMYLDLGNGHECPLTKPSDAYSIVGNALDRFIKEAIP